MCFFNTLNTYIFNLNILNQTSIWGLWFHQSSNIIINYSYIFGCNYPKFSYPEIGLFYNSFSEKNLGINGFNQLFFIKTLFYKEILFNNCLNFFLKEIEKKKFLNKFNNFIILILFSFH